MAPPLVTRSTGDIIPASDHNDVKAYIEDGSYRTKTAYLNLVPTGSPPTVGQGNIYFDTSSSSLRVSNDGTNYVPIGGGINPTYIVKTGGTVGVDCTHTTIASAITAAETAGNPVTIYIRNGTYTEVLTLTSADNGLTLVGESMYGVIIQKTSGSGYVIQIGGTAAIQGITIKNLTVLSSGSGAINCINLVNLSQNGTTSKGVTITGCYITSSCSGFTATSALIYAFNEASSASTRIDQFLQITNNIFYAGVAVCNIGIRTTSDNTCVTTTTDWIISNNSFIGKGPDQNPSTPSTNFIGVLSINNYNANNSGVNTFSNGIISNNTFDITSTGTYCTALYLSSSRDGTTATTNTKKITLANNIIQVIGATNNYGIYLIRDATSDCQLDGITMTGNYINTSTVNISLINTPTNIVDAGNNKNFPPIFAPVGHYTVNGDLLDSSGNGYNATCAGITYTGGKIGQAVVCLGNSSTRITTATNYGITGGSGANFAVACWVYIASTSVHGCFVKIGRATSGGYAVGVGNGNMDADGNNLMVLYEARAYHNTGFTFPSAGWYHIVYNMTNGLASVYVNNVLYTFSTSANGLAPDSTSGFGGYTNAATRDLTGYLDDIRIYSAPLSASDVATLYNSGNGTEA